jgi:YidC/Oxa1 family membrane protein insertase
VELLDSSPKRAYVAQTGLIGAAGLATHLTPMRFTGDKSLADGRDSLQLAFEATDANGVTVVKRYTFKRGSYVAEVSHEVRNAGPAAVSPKVYLQLVRDGNKPEGESPFYFTFTGPAFYTAEKKYHKVDFPDIEKRKAETPKPGNDGYVAMAQHYFASAWLLADGTPREFFANKVDTNLYSAGMITPVGQVNPGEAKTVNSRLFIGPQAEKELEKLYPGLELLKDYGYFTLLAKPLYWLLDQIYKIVGNWGWAIVGLVVLLKIAFYWLNATAYRSMAKMKAINPKVMEVRERLKDKPQEMQQAMMKIYRDEKVNPMGGCFPMLIQIPVFIALYWVLLSSVEVRNAPWILWVKDLSAPDPLFILPLVMTCTTLLQTWLNPTPPDPLQAKMMWILPMVFSVMFFFFPAGLVLYYTANNILSIAQQWLINKQLGVLGK